MSPEELAALPDDQLQNVVLNGVATLLEDAGIELERQYGGDVVTQVGKIGNRKVHVSVEIES